MSGRLDNFNERPGAIYLQRVSTPGSLDQNLSAEPTEPTVAVKVAYLAYNDIWFHYFISFGG